MPAEPDFYNVLGVEAVASAAEIKAAYRRRSREVHPDYNPASTATREMARLNEAYAVLSDRDQRERYDLSRPKTYARVRTAPAIPPATGRGSLQPDRFPDWYEFLGLRAGANAAEVLLAAHTLSKAIREARYATEVEDRLYAQLRNASEWLTTPALKAIYDAAWDGTPPAPGTHAQLHTDFYSFLGVRMTASAERIAARVTQLSGKAPYGSRDYNELAEAWRVLRDPERRAAYDRELAEAATVS